MKYWHIIILLIAFALMVSIIRGDANSTPIDYISGLGSVASIYAIIIALVEIRTVKKTTRETKKAVEKKLDEINNFLSYAEVEKHLEKCTSIAPYLQGERIQFRTPNYSKILNAMQLQPTLTLADMKEVTGISVAAIQKLLDQLQEKKFVERGEKDGSWRVYVTQ